MARPSLPAELSGLHEMLRDALQEALGSRTQAEESMISARAGELARGKTRTYRGAIGGLAAALVALLSWAATQVQAYGDGRAEAAQAALRAEAKAEEARVYAEETRGLAEAAARQVDALDRKLDRLLSLAETEAEQQAAPARVVVPTGRKGGR